MKDENLQYLLHDVDVARDKSFDEKIQQIRDDIGQIEGVFFMLQAFDKSGLIISKYGNDLKDREIAKMICPPLFCFALKADGYVNRDEYCVARAVLAKFGIEDYINTCLSLEPDEAGQGVADILNDAVEVMEANPDNLMVVGTVNDLPKRIYQIVLYLIACDEEFADEEVRVLLNLVTWLESWGAELW